MRTTKDSKDHHSINRFIEVAHKFNEVTPEPAPKDKNKRPINIKLNW